MTRPDAGARAVRPFAAIATAAPSSMVMLAAEILLRRVQALLPTVEGLTLPDLGDAATWEVHGLITREEGRRALQIIRDQLTGPTGQCYAGL